jgi:hypothetical protein
VTLNINPNRLLSLSLSQKHITRQPWTLHIDVIEPRIHAGHILDLSSGSSILFPRSAFSLLHLCHVTYIIHSIPLWQSGLSHLRVIKLCLYRSLQTINQFDHFIYLPPVTSCKCLMMDHYCFRYRAQAVCKFSLGFVVACEFSSLGFRLK